MADRRALQLRCAELKKSGHISAHFRCNASSALLRAEITRALTRASVATPTEVGLPNELLGIISIYATTAVTIEVATMSRDSGRVIYSGSVWKEKIQYETQGLMIDSAVIEAAKGESTNVWFRYYLCKNRTFWGSALHTSGRKETKVTPVSFPGPVTGGCIVPGSSQIALQRLVVQLDDLRIAIKIQPRERQIRWIFPFRERIREYINHLNTVTLVTERNTVHRITFTGEFGCTLDSLPEYGDDIKDLTLWKTSEANAITLLRRDGTLYTRTEAGEVLQRYSSDRRVTQVFSATGFSFSVLPPDGIEVDRFGDKKASISYDISQHGTINGVVQYGLTIHQTHPDIAMSHGRFYVLAGRSTVYSRIRRGKDGDDTEATTELVEVPSTKNRTQSISGYVIIGGLIIVDQ